jgi:nucleoside-diphosphate-sugar epimerase
MHLLVTGNQGYIGPVLTRLARLRGHRVTGLDIGYFARCLSPGATDVPADRQIVRDIRDVGADDLVGIDAIIHLAGLSNDPMGALDERLTFAINLDASVRLGSLAKRSGIGRFVFASSCSIYGAAGDNAALDESAAFSPASAYAVSKIGAEEGLAALADDAFSPVFMRNATAYGVSPRMRFDLVLNNLLASGFTSGTVRVMSDGTPWRPLVHIEDIALAAILAAEAPREAVHAQAFNIGRNDANYRVSEIAETAAATLSGARIEITGETGGDPRSYRVRFDKALSGLPGFNPIWTLDLGATEIANWLRASGLAGTDWNSRLFIRLKQLRHAIDTGAVSGLDLRRTDLA